MNKPLSDERILHEVKKVGRVAEYERYRARILSIMDEATSEGQPDYAAFLFAFSSVGNAIQKRKNGSKSQK